MKKQLLFLLMLMPMVASADPVSEAGLYFNLDRGTKTAQVTFNEPQRPNAYKGDIVIPPTIIYNGVKYTVTSIDGYAFLDCYNLTSISIPNTVTEINYDAFRGCTSLTSVEIPNSVTFIGSGAFEGCTGLTSITIPSSVTFLGGHAFYGCTGLTSIFIPKSVTTIQDVFLEYCSNITSIEVESGNPVYDSRNGCNAIIHTSTNRLIQGCKNSIIPNGVRHIGPSAFESCSGLTSITIPPTVETIDGSAFLSSGLTSVVIPDGVTAIRVRAFEGCKQLTSVVLPNSVTTIEDYVCKGCTSLSSVTIPNSVTHIKNYAFQGCSALTSFTIPSSVTTLGYSIWSGCENLTDVYCFADSIPSREITFIRMFSLPTIKNATLHVPSASLELYKEASEWCEFGTIVALNGKCSMPTITLVENGKVNVKCDMEGAKCVTSITASNAVPLSDGDISLNSPLTVYTVKAYATAEGYYDSDIATARFIWERTDGDMDGNGKLEIGDVTRIINTILNTE